MYTYRAYNGLVAVEDTEVGVASLYHEGDVVRMEFNGSALSFYVNGALQSVVITGIMDPIYPAVSSYGSDQVSTLVRMQLGQHDPTGQPTGQPSGVPTNAPTSESNPSATAPIVIIVPVVVGVVLLICGFGLCFFFRRNKKVYSGSKGLELAN